MKAQYKTIATAFAAALMAVACSAADTAAAATASGTTAATAAKSYMPRSEWHALVSDCAQDPAKLQATIAKISPDEQVAFLTEVNAAIAKMPGSDEARCAAFVKANEAAVVGAKESGNMKGVLAAVYATVPPEYLTEINERFAKEIVARGPNTSDATVTAIAKSVVKATIAACKDAENAGVRETFAILTMLRAANGSPKDLQETLVALLPDEKTQNLAKNEWIGPAMGVGQEQTYDPMLGASQAGDEPDHTIVASLAGPADIQVAMMADLEAGTSAAKMGGGAFVAPGSVAGTAPNDWQADTGLNRIPRGAVEQKTDADGNANPYYTNSRGNTTRQESAPGYNGQVL